jgi:hypothetical protein
MIKFSEFKKFFLFSLIGSLIVSALVAVVTVLVGEFDEVAGRVLLTLSMVVTHSLISLFFIWNDEKQDTFEKLSFFINVLFVLIVISFFTSIFGIWEIISGKIVWRLYQTYFVFGFASLHKDLLSRTLGKKNYIDKIVYANYIFIVSIVLMLQLVIYTENPFKSLAEMFFRVLGATAIIDGTLSVLTIIFYKLYIHKHPEIQNSLHEERDQKSKKGLPVWLWILIIYLALQMIIPLIYSVSRSLF